MDFTFDQALAQLCSYGTDAERVAKFQELGSLFPIGISCGYVTYIAFYCTFNLFNVFSLLST